MQVGPDGGKGPETLLVLKTLNCNWNQVVPPTTLSVTQTFFLWLLELPHWGVAGTGELGGHRAVGINLGSWQMVAESRQTV